MGKIKVENFNFFGGWYDGYSLHLFWLTWNCVWCGVLSQFISGNFKVLRDILTKEMEEYRRSNYVIIRRIIYIYIFHKIIEIQRTMVQ